MDSLNRKLGMSGDELRNYYLHIAPVYKSPLMTSMLALGNLLIVVFFYELLSYALLTGLRRMFEDER